MTHLPLLTLYLSERCNSRCVTCDYWRHGKDHLELESVRALLPSLRALRTQTVLLSGGEPLLNPQWKEIADLLRGEGLALWLLTSGLSLAKQAQRVAQVFESVTVSLDGAWRETYARIRGVDAFDVVCRGIRQSVAAGVPVGLRVTLQRANYHELPDFIELAVALGVRQLSFLAVDVASGDAFGRAAGTTPSLALAAEDLPVFDHLLDEIERRYAAQFASGLIAESPAKLRRLAQYFAAVLGHRDYPAVRCNAPEFSAVIDARLRVRPCFFIPGARDGALSGEDRLEDVLSSDDMRGQRAQIRSGLRGECATCVCSSWRDPADPRPLRLSPARGVLQ